MKILRLANAAALTALLCISAAQAQTAEPTIEEAKKALAEAAEKARQDRAAMTFEEFKASVYKEPGEDGKYIVNGDTPIVNEKHLREFYDTRVKQAPKPKSTSGDAATELIVHQRGGLDAVWSTGDKRRLTYCVSNSFGQNYAKVVVAMGAATEAWERVADLDFLHLSAEDSGCTASNTNVLFDVRPVNFGQYLARAFFPGESRASRNVLIDASSFDLDPNGNLTLVGILRHELGHTLGFRHEHTRPDSGTCFEDTSWRELTSYDAFSAMHYPQCNGQGDWSLRLTDLDKNGAACLYGPAQDFTINPAVCTSTSATQTKTEKYEGHTVNNNAERRYGPFRVKPNTAFVAKLEPAGSTPGDPDLYVKFDVDVRPNFFDCRPYLIGADEECSLDVPAGQQAASVMVHGYTEGDYTLTVTYTSPN